jgi:hypothetical protein
MPFGALCIKARSRYGPLHRTQGVTSCALPPQIPIPLELSLGFLDYFSNRELLGKYVGQLQGRQTLVQGPLDHHGSAGINWCVYVVESVECTRSYMPQPQRDARLRTYIPPILPTLTPIKLHYYNNITLKQCKLYR